MTRSSNLAMRCYSLEPRMRKYIKGYRFLSFSRNPTNKYEIQVLDNATKIGLDALETASKELFHKEADVAGESVRIKITDKIMKLKPLPAENSIDAEEMIIPPGNREEILNELRQVL